MTLSAHLIIEQDGEVLVEKADLFHEEGEDCGVVGRLLEWLVEQGRDARDALYGPPPEAAPKLPREAWDPEARR